jgi:hypothetical protein
MLGTVVKSLLGKALALHTRAQPGRSEQSQVRMGRAGIEPQRMNQMLARSPHFSQAEKRLSQRGMRMSVFRRDPKHLLRLIESLVVIFFLIGVLELKRPVLELPGVDHSKRSPAQKPA